ncbi:hypothetical protein UlMin_026253 [Ulmus minor]
MATILYLIIISLLLLLPSHSRIAFSEDTEDEEEYLIDGNITLSRSRSSPFLASHIIKKGRYCDPIKNKICNGVSANNGTSMLYCCKRRCRDVLGDRNNCGRCERKCKFEERCCHGTCTNVLSNVNNCGKCDKKCNAGVSCNFGVCGYA